MELAGLDIPDAEIPLLVKRLAAVGHEDAAATLTSAYTSGTDVVALTCDERDNILGVLDDPPEALCELRAVLLEQHTWRQREGLV